jgi:N-acetylmuramic acid 6-phosphate (MurNAc-6-P) etherase
MLKKCFFISAFVPFLLHANFVLDFLKVVPSEESHDFVVNKQQFQLHTLLTEQRHPKTWDLSSKIQRDTLEGIQSLLDVDIDVSQKMIELSEDTALLEQAADSVKNAILKNNKIYIYGCGATGRLAKQMESSLWRPFWQKIQSKPYWESIAHHFPNIENRLIGEMTGADRALISSLEGLEDLQLIGKLQLKDHCIQKGDVTFAITEGGETSSVIGTILSALSHYDDFDQLSTKKNHLYFIYNNPEHLLLPFERSKMVLENDAITKICLATGPQSITGSTRMQATTSETFVMGIIIEQALYELLKPYLSQKNLEELGFYDTSIYERLLSFLPIQKAVYDLKASISQLTDLESNTYKNKAFSTYFAKDGLLTVFIDSTERAPTFRLFPLDASDVFPRKSWIQVWTPATDTLNAWENFLGRPFYGLDEAFYETPFSEEIEDLYLKKAALRSLKSAGTEQQFLYDFSYSLANIQTHGPQKNDLGVMALFADEIEQLANPLSPFQSWLKTFEEKGAKTAVILVSPAVHANADSVLQVANSLNPETLILKLPIDAGRDPLQLRQHIGLKMLLNAHSTGVMAKLGRVVGNTMTNVNPGNLKLIGRATFLILSHVNDRLLPEEKISYADANAILFDSIEYGKKVQKTGQNAEVGLCIIRILEALKNKAFISWEDAEIILQNQGLEKYLN